MQERFLHYWLSVFYPSPLSNVGFSSVVIYSAQKTSVALFAPVTCKSLSDLDFYPKGSNNIPNILCNLNKNSDIEIFGILLKF